MVTLYSLYREADSFMPDPPPIYALNSPDLHRS